MTPRLPSQTPGGQNHDRQLHESARNRADAGMASSQSSDPAGYNDPVQITAVQRMLSAMSGSLLTGLLVTPLDVVRVRLQSQPVRPTTTPNYQKLPADFPKLALSESPLFRPANLGVTACCREVFFMNSNAEYCLAGERIGSATAATPAVECAVEQTQQRTFNSTLDGLRKIARNEGLTTLWRGLSPTLLMAIPGNIIYFTGYEWLRYDRASPISRLGGDTSAPLVAGGVARILAATAVGPVELFRTRLQASHGETAAGHLRDTLSGIRSMVEMNGYRSLWRGLTLTLWRDVPFSGMYWYGYETIRGRLTDARERYRGRQMEPTERTGRARRANQSREGSADTFLDSFVAGAASGAISSIVTMPFDVGKTRTQVFRDAEKGAAGETVKAAVPEEQSMVRLLWHIFKTEGVPGLFKGWIPRTLKVAPACAIMISSYEVGKRAFRGVNERAALKEREAN